MESQSFNLMRKALYESSEEMTTKIIFQKNRRIQQLELLVQQLKLQNKALRDELNLSPLEEIRQKALQKQFITKAGPFKVWSDLEKKQQLSVIWSSLVELPLKFCHLIQLKVLYLCGNQLKSLPQNICSLKQLRQLQLYSNKLIKLPQTLGNLSKLQRLWIHNNPNLKELPKSLKNLKQLEDISIDWQLLPTQNVFKTEPFASLKNLQEVNIDNNDHNKQRREAIKKEGLQMKIQVCYWINGQWQ